MTNLRWERNYSALQGLQTHISFSIMYAHIGAEKHSFQIVRSSP